MTAICPKYLGAIAACSLPTSLCIILSCYYYMATIFFFGIQGPIIKIFIYYGIGELTYFGNITSKWQYFRHRPSISRRLKHYLPFLKSTGTVYSDFNFSITGKRFYIRTFFEFNLGIVLGWRY